MHVKGKQEAVNRPYCDLLVGSTITANETGFTNLIEENSLIPMIRGDIAREYLNRNKL